MNRRTRTLIVVGMAVVLAGFAAFGVLRVLQNRPVVQVEIAERHIVVAAAEIPSGTMLTPDMVRLQAWPADSVVPGAFATVEEVVNRGVIDDVLPSEPITEAKLAAVGAGAGLQTTIPPGMRAVAVRVNDVIGVAGFAGPGPHVDVVVTANPAGREYISRVVVANVEVLSAGTLTDRTQTAQGNPTPASVVTLLVTPPDAEKITLAQNQGQIALALRNPLDVEMVETKGVRMSALIGEPDPPPVTRRTGGVTRVVAPPPPPPDPTYRVEMVKGAKVEEVIIK